MIAVADILAGVGGLDRITAAAEQARNCFGADVLAHEHNNTFIGNGPGQAGEQGTHPSHHSRNAFRAERFRRKDQRMEIAALVSGA